MKRKWKQWLSVILLAVYVVGLYPVKVAEVQAATSAVSLSNLGELGPLRVGTKTKDGNWWQMHVGGEDAFCMTLGYTCHTGDSYQSSSAVYRSTDGGIKGKKAYIGYWYDKVQKQSNSAYIMAQALFWGLEEGETSESKLKAVIKTVKKNTGKFSGKTAEQLYEDIFERNGAVSISVLEWNHTGSGSKRQKLLTVKASGEKEPKPLSLHVDERYRQRINLEKKDESGGPLGGVTFSVEAQNIDELYGMSMSGKDSGNINGFTGTGTTNAEGRLQFCFEYRIQTGDYFYYLPNDIEDMTSGQKEKLSRELDEKGYAHAPDLTEDGAREMMEKDLKSQLASVNNLYTITEKNAGTENLFIPPEYKNGRTIRLAEQDSWLRGSSGQWPETELKLTEENMMGHWERITNKYKKVSLEIVKRDGYSKDAGAHGEATLEGTVFQLFQDAACAVRAVVYDEKGKEKKAGNYTIKNGTLETDYLRCGTTYFLKEIASPPGYRKSEKIIPVTVDGSHYTQEFTSCGKKISCDNEPVLGKIALKKYYSDGETGKLSCEEGASFQIYLKKRNSFEKADEYERDLLVTDEKGYACSKDLYMGRYTVHQTDTGKQDAEKINDFDIVIDEHGKVYEVALNNKNFSAYLKIVKKDGNTKKTVLKAGTSYQIYRLNKEDGSEQLVRQSYVDGKGIQTIDVFQTDVSGVVMTVKPLKSGIYRVYEREAAENYYIAKPYIEVEINSKKNNYSQLVDENGVLFTTVEAEYENKEACGKLTFEKTGEQLAAYDKTHSDFVYEESALEGASFEIYAAEEIGTPDNQGTVWFEKGELAAKVVSGEGAEFSKPCGGLCGCETDGSGRITILLPLGKYKVVETETVDGYVLPEQPEWQIEFTWKNKDTPQVLNQTEATDDDGVLRVRNERAKTKVVVNKRDAERKIPIAGTVFGLYTKNPIYNSRGELIVPADTKLGQLQTGAAGKAESDIDLPLRQYISPGKENTGDYYLMEERTSESYYMEQEKIPMHFEYQDDETPVVSCEIVKENTATKAEIDKLSLVGSGEVPGCRLQIEDEDGQVICSWTSGDKKSVRLLANAEQKGYQNLAGAITERGNLSLYGLFHNREYSLAESRPADGYATAEKVYFKLLEKRKEDGAVCTVVSLKNKKGSFDVIPNNQVVMYDDTTKVEFSKLDDLTGNPVEGAGIVLYDNSGSKVSSFTTKKNGAALIEGELAVGETYIFREVKAPNGYAASEDVAVTVQDTGEIQKVVMFDKKINQIKDNNTPRDSEHESQNNVKMPKKVPKSAAPRTGDSAILPEFLITVLLLAAAGIIVAIKKAAADKRAIGRR